MESEVFFLSAIAVRTTIVFLFIVIGLRLSGMRQAGELNLHDILLVLILANSVQNAMTKGNGQLTVALVSSGTLILLGWTLRRLLSRHPNWEPWAVGLPVVIAENGRMLRRVMRREGVTGEDVMGAVREQGMSDLAGVKLVILEVDGSISVIPCEPKSGG